MSEERPVAALSWRGDIVENSHAAHVAIVDAQGTLLRSFGDPHRLTLARSAAKPAQALAVIETGAMERFGFDDADLALMCGSHSSEERHIARTRGMLAKAGVDETALRCGGHPSLSETVQRNWLRQGFEPGPVCSNCSGKHAGMLAAARALGAPIEDYHLPQHPIQQRTRAAVAAACGLPDEDVQWAVDGCNLPTPAFALDHLALLFARLAAAADTAPASAQARIFRAMTTYPELVAGEDRFCTRLMQVFGGALAGKVGADASYAIGVRASAATARLGAPGGLGIAVKIEDGNTQVLYAVVCELLQQLELADAAALDALARFHAPRVRNTAGREVGHISLPIRLR